MIKFTLKPCVVMISLLPILLSGCMTDRNIPFEGSKRDIGVRQEAMFYGVRFAQNKSEISNDEKKSIQSFVQNFAPRRGEQMQVSFKAASTSGAADLSATRSRAVLQYLRELGFNPDLAAPPESIMDNEIAIIRLTPKLVLPNCPDWSQNTGSTYDNAPHSNMNCASTTNLGLMVDNPMDLVSPRDMSPADGPGSVLSIQRYRTDKTRELLKDSPTTKQQ